MGYRNLISALTLTLLAACGGGDNDSAAPSSNANLTSLILESAILAPGFSAATTNYTATVTGGTDSTRVTAVTANTGARLRIDGISAVSGTTTAPIPLPIGATLISIEVTAADGTVKTYQVTVTRPQPNTDADLARLELTAAGLDQIFDSAQTDYTATTGHLGASTRVIAEFSDPLADALALDGVAFQPGDPSHYVALSSATPTTLSVRVTAEDTITTRTYQVAASRADFATLAQRAYVKATASGQDRFGFGLALAGDNLLVGAPLEQSSATGVDGNDTNNTLTQAGAAYLYQRVAGFWTVGNYLKASNTDAGDLFGWAAAATSDRLVVGAPGEQSLGTDQQDNTGSSAGAVYVFANAGPAGPAQTDYLKAANPDSLDAFGGAIAADGDRILVGAQFEASSATGVNGDGADNTLTDAGAVYLFEDNGAGFSQTNYLKASNTDSGDQFGNAVSISGDTLAIGAWREDSAATGINGDQTSTAQRDSGAVYLFDRSVAGAWRQSAYVKASNTEQDDNFGSAVALDGDWLAVGAPGESSASSNQQDNSLQGAGAVYVFRRDSAGNWVQEAYLKPTVTGGRDFFGGHVALVGNMLAVGASGERSDAIGINGNDTNQNAVDSGAVYLFERDAAGNWSQIAYLKASNTDPGDLFGRSLALSGDTLAVSAYEEQSAAVRIDGDQNNNTLTSAGAVYLFR